MGAYLSDENAITLNFLYQSSDAYALPTGVSIASLLENNQGIDEINIFIVSDGISERNLKNIENVCSSYGRTLCVRSANDILASGRVEELDLPKWNDSLVIYSKLFAVEQLDFPGDIIIYIDGDTIINKPLDELAQIGGHMAAKGAAVAACYDFYLAEFKEIYGVAKDELFINTGMLVINRRNWIEKGYLQKIIDHMHNVRGKYITADQDIINMIFRDEIELIDPTYNFNSGFYLYGLEDYLDMYHLRGLPYVDEGRLRAILQDGPHINHCMVNMCGRPWEKQNHHPQNALFDEYLAMTPWTAVDKLEPNRGIMFQLQYAAFKYMPRWLYKQVYPQWCQAYWKRLDRSYVSG